MNDGPWELGKLNFMRLIAHNLPHKWDLVILTASLKASAKDVAFLNAKYKRPCSTFTLMSKLYANPWPRIWRHIGPSNCVTVNTIANLTFRHTPDFNIRWASKNELRIWHNYLYKYWPKIMHGIRWQSSYNNNNNNNALPTWVRYWIRTKRAGKSLWSCWLIVGVAEMRNADSTEPTPTTKWFIDFGSVWARKKRRPRKRRSERYGGKMTRINERIKDVKRFFTRLKRLIQTPA